MSEHEGPWFTVDRGGDCEVDIDAPDDAFGQVTVAMNIGSERARRIVACVNACAGVPTEDLEAFQRPADLSWMVSYSSLAQQRDKLLAALKASRETLQRVNDTPYGAINDTIWHTNHETLFDFMDAAIEETESTK